MANYATLKAAIADVIKTNGTNAITGAILQQSLLSMINSLGANYQFAGVANPETDPGTPDQNVFYIAGTDGTYSNFNGITLTDGEIAILSWNGQWQKTTTNIAGKNLISAVPNDNVNYVGEKEGGNKIKKGDAELVVVPSIKSVAHNITFDFSGSIVGKYLSTGSADTDSSYNHKEFDITDFRGKILLMRLGYALNTTNNYLPLANTYIQLSDNSIVSAENYVFNDGAEMGHVMPILIPNNATKLLATWAVNVYGTFPFIIYSLNYNKNFQSFFGKYQWLYGIAGLVKEIDRDNYTVHADSYIKTNGDMDTVSGLGISVVEIPVEKGTVLFVRGESGASNGIVFTYNSVTQKYEPIESHDKIDVGGYIYYIFTKLFGETKTVYVNDWKLGGRANNSIAVGNIKDYSNTIFQDIKEIQRNLPTPVANNVKYVAIGDSITDGTGATESLGSYAKRLHTHFNFQQFTQLAAGGMSSVRQDGQYSTYPLLKNYVSQVNNFKGIISVSIGTNDYGNGHSPLGTLDQIKNVPYASLTPTPSEYDATYTFAQGFRYDLETLKRQNPDATIVVLSPINRVGELTEYVTGGTLQAYRDMEEAICEMLGIIYVDMRKCGISRWNASPVWSADNLHPNDYGYYLMTSYLIPIFESLLRQQNYLNDKL